MNTIASLIAIDPDQAESAILDLSELFRSTLNNQKMLISAEEELTLCKRYLNIEGLRLGKRLRLRWDVEQSILPIKIPPLTLQPLLENAIYHGIQPLTEGGEISIHAYCKAEVAYILISNPLPKSPQEHHGNQIALNNIQQRLAAIFGSAAIIKTSHLDDQFTVTLRLPVEIAK
jgi:two-component system sensor histidine kinase AlgZ